MKRNDCGMVEDDRIEEPNGCAGPNGEGFDPELCKGCDFYPENIK